jgi:hypothetical protein
MAEPGGWQEATDVIRDAVAIREELCLAFYEHAGWGMSNEVAVFRLTHDGAQAVWHAYVEPRWRIQPACSALSRRTGRSSA